MLKQWIFRLKIFSRRLSVRATFFAVLAVTSSLMAAYLDYLVPDRFADIVGGRAVESILSVMASSMLIVVTFSLSTMVTSYGSAIQSATPRAASLIIEDSRSHSAISIFLGSFIYSVVSLIAVTTDYYGEKGRVILLLMSVIVLIAVVWEMVHLIEDLKNMSSVSETIRRVEERTVTALKERLKRPTYGCQELDIVPEKAHFIPAKTTGHVQNIDIETLVKIAEKEDLTFYLENEVGSFIHSRSKLLHIEGKLPDEKILDKIRQCFGIGPQRTFEYDPRYGITVLSGIGVKALSPSLNDPGTAIDVVGRLVRIISLIEEITPDKDQKIKRIFLRKPCIPDIFNDAFYGLSKDAAGHLGVIKSLQEGMKALQEIPNQTISRCAAYHLNLINTRAEHVNDFPTDLQNISSSKMIGENHRH